MNIFVRQLFQSQNGYLYEIPIILLLASVVAGLVGTLLPESWKTVLFAALGLLAAVFLIYHFFFVGWRARHK